MKVTVSETARKSLLEIIDFLRENWTAKEIAILQKDIKKFASIVSDGIVKHPSIERFPNIQYTLIGKKNIKLFYEIKKDEVVIKLFLHCKQNPESLNDIFSTE